MLFIGTLNKASFVAKASKRIYYFRSVGVDGQPVNFHSKLKALISKMNISQTEISFVDEVIRVQRRKEDATGTLIHLSKYSPGNKNSTLTPKSKKLEEEEIGQAPPPGKEYKSGECFVFVKGADILFCSHGIHHSKAELYFHSLFQKNKIKVNSFKFSAASDLDKINILNAQGVNSIKLNVNAYKLSLPEEKETTLGKAFSSVKREIAALVGKDKTRSEEKTLENLTVSIEIGLTGNTRASPEAQTTVQELASEFLDEDTSAIDSFVIMTRDGTPITANDIRLHDVIRVGKTDSSINHVDVWNGFVKYYKSLKTDNLLEQ